ncbi:RPM1-interacting protein 4-like isoform X5 [Carica papaya]|uniref:RPM1-interacting protein 4-like isoform X5 n=1 Tax=Carica papaya TaxID=3649 RepID=UPI000B8CDE7A|nr:RPM1-interacting protein 4-like isoform X5 [Carica papaya]
MAQQSNLPTFGNWENEEDVHYTAYFEKVRKKKTGMKIDLSDAQQNLGTYSSNKSPVRDPHSQTKAKTRAEGVPNAVMTKTEHCANREDDLNRPTESTLYHPVIARPHSQGQGRRVTSSPLHSHGGAKVGGEGSGMSSPSWERKGSSENNTHGLAPLTPTRSRLRAVNRGNESKERKKGGKAEENSWVHF